jgi:Tol biopolymer transport system component/tRNA A-37 threonylcarbamoyl transferase component Bud32
VIGKTLSHYRITAALGAGGMGEVYRATDTKLGRQVAIKVLPQEVSQDPERLARFQREAQLLASLNHPNIAAIHGLEEVGGTPFLVLELVEGEDLKQRLERGAIPVDEAIDIAGQVAEGLEAAHETGVIHRDLKPANVKLTVDGQVKILDFGLAKAFAVDTASAGSSSDLSQSPTLAHTGTQAGIILGTAAYMSPEQARGKAVDKRADIWAFGVLLWEMLTGRSLFSGETVSDTLAAVLRQEVDWGRLPGEAPAGIRGLLRRCLERDPTLRLRDIGEARIRLASDPAEAEATEPPQTRAGLRRIGPGVVLALVVGGLLTGLVSRWIEPDPAPVPLRKYRIPAARQRGGWNTPTAALSPDGARVAYVDAGQLWVRELRDLTPRRVSSSRGAGAPFWSPDGRSIGYFDRQTLELKGVFLIGGEERSICPLPRYWEAGVATWGSTGAIVFSTRTGRLHEVPSLGGEPRLRLEPDPARGVTAFAYPQFLPGEERLLAVAILREGEQRAVIVSGEEWALIPGMEHDVSFARFSPTGHILYARGKDGGIWAAPFSVPSGRATGKAFRVSETGIYPMASGDGTLMYVSPDREQMAWVDRAGRMLAPIGQPQPLIHQPAISPDGRLVAVSGLEGGRQDIWIHDSDRGTKWPLTADAPIDSQPAWAPSGKMLVFTSTGRSFGQSSEPGEQESKPVDYSSMSRWVREAETSLFFMPAEGNAEPTPVVAFEERTFEADLSRDGKHVVFATLSFEDQGESEDPDYDIWVLALSEGSTPAPLVATPASELLPALAPDGRHVAFMSDRTGRLEIYVSSFPDARQTWGPISTDGGVQPKWSARGELFYIDAGGLMAVKLDTTSGFSWSTPERVFTQEQVGARLVDPAQLPIAVRYAVADDGERFVVVRSLAGPDSGITIVQNWLAEFDK